MQMSRMSQSLFMIHTLSQYSYSESNDSVENNFIFMNSSFFIGPAWRGQYEIVVRKYETQHWYDYTDDECSSNYLLSRIGFGIPRRCQTQEIMYHLVLRLSIFIFLASFKTRRGVRQEDLHFSWRVCRACCSTRSTMLMVMIDMSIDVNYTGSYPCDCALSRISSYMPSHRPRVRRGTGFMLREDHKTIRL